MALAFAAMNTIFGPFFQIEAAELLEPAAALTENKGHTFIFDVQTHHVAMPSQNPHADSDFLNAVVGMRDMASKMNPALKGRKGKIDDAYLENYIKEIFLDSETDMVALVGLRHGTCTASLGADDELRYLARRIRERFPDVEIIVRGDSGIEYAHVVNVLEVLQQANVIKVSLATEPLPTAKAN